MTDVSTDIVWKNTVDEGKWLVFVERVDERIGTLVVQEVGTDNEIMRERVGLSYGAMFGPDSDDVLFWQEKAIEVIDSQ